MSKLLMHSGRIVDIHYPRAEDILIEDIAHHLARINRFNGGTKQPYSVAQHSVYVSQLCCESWALEGLMHDATEAYLGDVSSPLKELLPDYRRIERQWWNAIAAKYGLPAELPFDVHVADHQAYVAERLELIDHPFELDPDYEAFAGVIVPAQGIGPVWAPEIAERRFLRRFNSLVERMTIV